MSPRQGGSAGRAARAAAAGERGSGRKGDAARLRIFLAVFPPPQAQEVATAVIESLRRDGDGVSWVKRENLHYTVRFLGELGEDGTRRAAEAATEAASDHSVFEARLGGLGAFPSARGARVLWVGLAEGAERLVALARSVEAALVRRGFDREGRRFEAHLTLGRARDPHADWTEPLARGSAAVQSAGVAASFRVDRVVTVHSQLSPRGSLYTVRAEARLHR